MQTSAENLVLCKGLFSRSLDTKGENLKFQQSLKRLCFIYLTGDSPFTVKFVVEKETNHGE